MPIPKSPQEVLEEAKEMDVELSHPQMISWLRSSLQSVLAYATTQMPKEYDIDNPHAIPSNVESWRLGISDCIDTLNKLSQEI